MMLGIEHAIRVGDLKRRLDSLLCLGDVEDAADELIAQIQTSDADYNDEFWDVQNAALDLMRAMEALSLRYQEDGR